MHDSLHVALFLAGVGQLALVAASLAIPRVLRWREDTGRLRPLTREIFWTYAGYIWTTNLCFGLLAALAPGWLLDGSPLAAVVCGYTAAYWGARITIQFTCLDRTDAPAGWPFRVAEVALVSLFGFLTLVYSGALAFNLGGLGT
jgi:hypothetical protein